MDVVENMQARLFLKVMLGYQDSCSSPNSVTNIQAPSGGYLQNVVLMNVFFPSIPPEDLMGSAGPSHWKEVQIISVGVVVIQVASVRTFSLMGEHLYDSFGRCERERPRGIVVKSRC